MFRTFGQQLMHFARAVDIVRDEDFREIRNLVGDYLRENFGVGKVEFLRETLIEGQPGLAPQWNKEDTYGAYQLMRDGHPYGQNALAYTTGDPLWVIARNEGVLAEATDYLDLWSGHTDIPRFVRIAISEEMGGDRVPRRETTRMLISVPIELRGHMEGVLYCESDELYTPNEAAKQEFHAIAGSLGILYSLKKQSEATHQNTREAMKELSYAASQVVEFKVSKPSLFLAYGKGRDPQVLGIIRDVLHQYRDHIHIRDWEKEHPPGDITHWIRKEIISAKYLVCYLSDRTQLDGFTTFSDNPNVMFETGMFHALRESTDITVRQWLPIREGPPEEAPFDFRPMRMVSVPRRGDNELQDARFTDELEKAIRELLATDLLD